MKAIEAELRQMRPELQAFGVKNLWLFGSAVYEDEPSDVDVLVEFEEPPGLLEFMGLKEHLEQRLGKKVDLLSRAACQPRFLKRIEPGLFHVA